MKPRKSMIARMIVALLYILLGVTLIVCERLGMVDDFWSGLGTALIFIAVLQLFRLIRYKTSDTYKEQVDTAYTDERNRFLGMKAWAWAGYLYIIVAAVATIVFKLLEQEVLMYATSGSVCLILVLYWICYLILRKKY